MLRQYGFNQLAIVGRGMPAMLLFVARPTNGGSLAVGASFSRRVNLLKQKPGTTEGQRQAEALAVRGGQPAPLNSYPVPVLPSLRPEALPGREPVQGRAHHTLTANGPGDLRTAAEPAPVVVTERVPFDWRQAQVRRDNGNWKLVVGGYMLADFGVDEHSARQAQAALMHFRCTEHLLVGTPQPVVSYFLTGGQAPRGLMGGLFSDPFRPDGLTVRQVGQHYYLAEAGRPLLDCGPHPDEARYMLGVIRQHGFDNVCRIGLDDKHSLTFLVRSH